MIIIKKGLKLKKKLKVVENGPICSLYFDYKYQRVWVGTDFPGRYILRFTPKGKPLDYVVGHTGKVTCIVEADNLIWTSSSDRSIRVWDMDNADCIKILAAHSGPVYNLAVTTDYVVSVSWDKSIVIWDARVCSFFLFCYDSRILILNLL